LWVVMERRVAIWHVHNRIVASSKVALLRGMAEFVALVVDPDETVANASVADDG